MRHLLPLAVLMLMVSIGMSLDLRELVANWRRLTVSTWLRLLGITFVVPPVVALLVSRALGLSLPETAGLFMVGVAPGAPLLTRNIAKRHGHLLEDVSQGQRRSGDHLGPIISSAGGRVRSRTVNPHRRQPARATSGLLGNRGHLGKSQGLALPVGRTTKEPA